MIFFLIVPVGKGTVKMVFSKYLPSLENPLIVSAIYNLEWWCVLLSTSRREEKAFLNTILKGLYHEMNLAFDDMY
jgi:hypothetical protein